MDYKVIETGLDLGTKFLTVHSAYFLGSLLADEREIIGEKIYWSAPIRHNSNSIDSEGLEKHLNSIKSLARVINKERMTHTLSFYKAQNVELKKFKGKKGIVTLFEEKQPNYTIEELVNDIWTPLLESSTHIIRAFIIGMFDGRGSDDGGSYIVVDYDNIAVEKIIVACLQKLEINYNLNKDEGARERNSKVTDPGKEEKNNSDPRKKQIRINRNVYLSKIGFISETRFNMAFKKLSKPDQYLSDELDLLPGLKVIQNSQTNLF